MSTMNTQVGVMLVNINNIKDMLEIIVEKHFLLFDPETAYVAKIKRFKDFWFAIWRRSRKEDDTTQNLLVQLPEKDWVSVYDTRDLSCILFESISVADIFYQNLIVKIIQMKKELNNV